MFLWYQGANARPREVILPPGEDASPRFWLGRDAPKENSNTSATWVLGEDIKIHMYIPRSQRWTNISIPLDK